MIRARFHGREHTLKFGRINWQYAYFLEFHTLDLGVGASSWSADLPEHFQAQGFKGRLFSCSSCKGQRSIPRQKIECAASVYSDHRSPAILLPLPGDGAIFVMEFVQLFGLEIRIDAGSSARR